MAADTNRAQDFLDPLDRAKRGRLKIYLGFAAGVGKSVRMLKEAHALKSRGVDVAKFPFKNREGIGGRRRGGGGTLVPSPRGAGT